MRICVLCHASRAMLLGAYVLSHPMLPCFPSLRCARSYELSEKLTGCIAFSDISAPIVLVKLAVVRIELADGEVRTSMRRQRSLTSLFDPLLATTRLCSIRAPLLTHTHHTHTHR